jgi:RNA polymerase sigma-70 factor (ECF subfamily)
MTKTEIFLEYESLLFSVAYNMLGLVADAEDMVQDTYEKWVKVNPAQVQNIKAYLVKAITNTSINHLDKLKRERKDYIGPWLPEPVVAGEENAGARAVEIFHPLSMGIMVMLEKLTPQERAVFLLKEVFSYDYSEIAEILNKTNDNCRQVLKRAHQHLKDDKKRFEIDMHMHERIFQQFLHACGEGDMQGLIHILQEDTVMITDGGGTAFTANGKTIQALRKPLHGRETVAKFVIAIVKNVQENVPGFNTKIMLVNGMPALACFSFNTPLSLIILEINNAVVSNVYVHSNKEKLRSLL